MCQAPKAVESTTITVMQPIASARRDDPRDDKDPMNTEMTLYICFQSLSSPPHELTKSRVTPEHGMKFIRPS